MPCYIQPWLSPRRMRHMASASHVDKVTKQLVLCSGQSPACH